MKNLTLGTKSSKHKKRKHHSSPEVCVVSSESENEISSSKDSDESEDHISLSSESSHESIVIKPKKRRHKCRHKDFERKERPNDGNGLVSHRIKSHRRHHHEHRHHRRKDDDSRKRIDGTARIKIEPQDYHPRHTHSTRKRYDDKLNEGHEDTEHSNHSHSSRHKHHQEVGSSDRARHRSSREDSFHRGEPSRGRRTSPDQSSRDKKENTGNRGSRGREERQHRNNDSSSQKSNRPIKKESASEDEAKFEWGRKSNDQKDDKKGPEENKAKPNFGLSGKLTEDTNTFNGVVIKYSEPSEARKPKRRWRLYPFKGDQGLPTLYIHRQSCYLIGRERKVADIPIDHPSCSKQHAALQYRLVPYEREDGTKGRRVRPYIIDLESSNGTFVNNVKIECKKYVELIEKDVIKFGYSSREYVLLHEQSKDEAADDDIPGND